MRFLGQEATATEWAWLAYLTVMSVALLALILGQMARTGPVQTVERDLRPTTAPADPLPCTSDDTLKLAAVRNSSIVCPEADR